MLADDLLEDARHLAAKGDAENRESCMRRAISTAYYAVFHLLTEDFVSHWPFDDQRARLARMFNHQKMRDAGFLPKDKNSPTSAETALMKVKSAFVELQGNRHRADYDLAWSIAGTDVADAIRFAEEIFVKWRSIRHDDAARHYLLSMFGANR